MPLLVSITNQTSSWNDWSEGRTLMAAVGQFKAEITGVGTHAAAPHNGNDPIVTACQVIANAQAIVARHTFSARTSGIKRIAYRSREYMECDSRESIFLKERFVRLTKKWNVK